MRSVIILGAGASKADGAPLQFELLREYFLTQKDQADTPMNTELRAFFSAFYGIDVVQVDERTEFPTFEEVLGGLELAIARNENFRIPPEPSTNIWDQQRIQKCREYVVTLICTILAQKLGQGFQPQRLSNHLSLVHNLPADEDFSFVSFNYDLLIDNAILWNAKRPNYGTTFANASSNGGTPVGLYKLHGSLNWLRCPICGALTHTGERKGASYPIEERLRCETPNCGSVTVPIVVPPTFFKVMADFHLQQVWHEAEKALAAAERLYFCGYSLPDADMHVRYLLKRAEVNSGAEPPIFIVNQHSGKCPAECERERKRYTCLFRSSSRVVYTSWSFEDFAKDPAGLTRRPRNEIEWTPPASPA